MPQARQLKKALASLACIGQQLPSCAPSVPNSGRGGLASSRNSCLCPTTRGRYAEYLHPFRRSFHATAASKDSHRLLYTQPEFAAGLLVEYKRDQKSGLALLQQPDGSKNWKAVDVRGHVYSLRPSQMSYILPGRDFTKEDMESVLAESSRQVNDSGDDLMMAAWEIVSDENNQLFTVTEMADLMFNQTDSASCYAAHCLLNRDRRYFKQCGRNPPLFSPRSLAEVTRFKEQAIAEQQAAEELANLQKDLWKASLQPFGQKPTRQQWLEGPWTDRLKALQEHALTGDSTQPDPSKLVRDTMTGLTKGNVTPQAAAELLKRLGYWQPHEQLGLLRAGWTGSFPERVQEAARDLVQAANSDMDSESRQDLRHVPAWAIDSEDTVEIDDAVGLEILPDGQQRIWIHVADPTCRVSQDSVLAAEALRRTTTLYLPTGSEPMFPRELAEEFFSLSPKSGTAALSVWITLDSDGAIADCNAVNTIVQPKRMSYDELNKEMEGTQQFADSILGTLHQITQLRKEWRKSQGAIFMDFPECDVRVKFEESLEPIVSLEGVWQGQSPARNLVSELMILANEAFASVGERNGVALVYRGQAEVSLPKPEDLENVPEGICRDTMIRNRMTRSVTTTAKPLPHATLGVQRYTQATSPIRRFSDMLIHWQIKACLRGESAPLDAAALSEIADDLLVRGREVGQLKRDITKYWLCHYFNQQREKDSARTYPAILMGWVRQDTGFANVILQEFGLEVAIRIQRPAKAGEMLNLKCTRANVSTIELEFEESQDVDEEMLPLKRLESEASDESVLTMDENLVEKV